MMSKRIKVNGILYEAISRDVRNAYSNAEDIAERVMDLGRKYVKGSYSNYDHVGREWSEALEFAHALKRNKDLYRAVKDNYEDVYLILEDRNFHTENLGLEALFDRKDFMRHLKMVFEMELNQI